jgi:hypothetical protein
MVNGIWVNEMFILHDNMLILKALVTIMVFSCGVVLQYQFPALTGLVFNVPTGWGLLHHLRYLTKIIYFTANRCGSSTLKVFHCFFCTFEQKMGKAYYVKPWMLDPVLEALHSDLLMS